MTKSNGIADKASLALLSISLIGMKRKDNRVTDFANENYVANPGTPQVKVQSSADKGYYRKNKYQRSDFEDILLTAGQARAHYRKATTAWDDKFRIIAGENIMPFMTSMAQFKERFLLGIEEKCRILPQIIKRNKHLLNDMYDVDDYITNPALFKQEFGFKYRIYPIPMKDHLVVELEGEIIEDVHKQMDKDREEEVQNMMSDLWKRFAAPVAKMVERLADEKPNFRKTLISNIEEQVTFLSQMNLTRDKQMNELLTEAHNRLCAFTPGQLKTDSAAREQTRKDAQDILNKVAAITGKK
jgi:hypothetical protein